MQIKDNKALGKLQGPSFEQAPVSTGSCWKTYSILDVKEFRY